jgi:hypothetical protein
MQDQVQVMRSASDDAVPTTVQNVEMAASVGRAVAEVKASMLCAKQFPRDEMAAFARLMKACKRPGLAEASQFEYVKGEKKVSGPTIRMAEAAAQAWGNLTFGIVEVEQRKGEDGIGESVVETFCHDLETNTRQVKRFHVRHVRDTKKGSYAITDGRDVYEMVANQGARRLRACILGVIPGDVIDSALVECDKTMKGANTEPLADRIRKMISVFVEVGVSQTAIEAKLCHKVDACSEQEVARLGKVYRAIKDGMTTPAEQFPAIVVEGKAESDTKAAATLQDRVGGKATGKKAASDPLPAGVTPVDALPL